MKQIRKRLTYANVMSSLAVFLVLGGATAFAATKIGAKELKANSVLTGKIKKEAVTTSKIKNNAINTAKIADKAVTGAKVDAASLGTVPNATNAAHATNADSAGTANTVKQITSFAYKADNGNTDTVVLNDFFGLSLQASCQSGANNGLTVEASSSSPLAHISFTSSWQAEDTANNAYGQISSNPLVIYSPTGTTKTTNGAVNIGFSVGQIVYSQPNGTARVSVNWEYGNNVAGNDCYWAGTVVGTA